MNMQAIFAVMSTTARAGLNYFQVLFFTAVLVVFIAAKIASIFLSLSAVHIYDFYIFIVKSYAN